MPNTKSAERRMRGNARKQARNRSIAKRLHTLERGYLQMISAGKKEDATRAFVGVSSAFDKAVKSGVVHRATANRKKSRLAVRLNAAGRP